MKTEFGHALLDLAFNGSMQYQMSSNSGKNDQVSVLRSPCDAKAPARGRRGARRFAVTIVCKILGERQKKGKAGHAEGSPKDRRFTGRGGRTRRETRGFAPSPCMPENLHFFPPGAAQPSAALAWPGRDNQRNAGLVGDPC